MIVDIGQARDNFGSRLIAHARKFQIIATSCQGLPLFSSVLFFNFLIFFLRALIPFEILFTLNV